MTGWWGGVNSIGKPSGGPDILGQGSREVGTGVVGWLLPSYLLVGIPMMDNARQMHVPNHGRMSTCWGGRRWDSTAYLPSTYRYDDNALALLFPGGAPPPSSLSLNLTYTPAHSAKRGFRLFMSASLFNPMPAWPLPLLRRPPARPSGPSGT